MKKIFLFLFVLSQIILTSCGGSSVGGPNADNSDLCTTPNFEAVVDGQTFRACDGLYYYQGDFGQAYGIISSQPNNEGTDDFITIGFLTPNQEDIEARTYVINNGTQTPDGQEFRTDFVVRIGGPYIDSTLEHTFLSTSGTLTVESVTLTHIRGTFSGIAKRMTNNDTVTVTDGRFDVDFGVYHP